MKRLFVFLGILVFLISDLSYSFIQHLNMPLDGDMAGGIVPEEDVNRILKDPLGLQVLTENTVYANPNRFFAHWLFFVYFNSVPLWLQHWLTPVDSVYMACALAKIMIQLILLLVLARFINGTWKFSVWFLLAAVLVEPFFQTNGYRSYMGIIDPSVTYTFFYALPCALVLLYYKGVLVLMDQQKPDGVLRRLVKGTGLVLFAFVTIFNGPLNPGIIIVMNVVLFYFGYYSKRHHAFLEKHTVFKFNAWGLFFLLFTSVLSLYALFIGRNNAIFIPSEMIPVAERYMRLPVGVFNILTQKLGVPVLVLALLLNVIVLKQKFPGPETETFLFILKILLWFIFLYIMLLPLGGYKAYRANILRYDTFMPVTLVLIFAYGRSAWLLLVAFRNQSGALYFFGGVCALLIFIYTLADEPEFGKNKRERKVLTGMRDFPSKTEELINAREVLLWNGSVAAVNPKLTRRLLEKWHIVTEGN